MASGACSSGCTLVRLRVRQTNVASFQPKEVTTIDGRVVLNNSEEWRLCCEAVCVLRMMPQAMREDHLRWVERHRGQKGLAYLAGEIARVEHAFILAMGYRNARRAYLDEVAATRGEQERKSLEARIVALWEQRKAG